MEPKLIVGVIPKAPIYKLHGSLVFGGETAKDTKENRTKLEQRGAHFFPFSVVRAFLGRPLRWQKQLNLDCTSCGACCAQREDRPGMVIDGILSGERDYLEAAAPECTVDDPRYGTMLRKQATPFPGIVACPFFVGKAGALCSCSIYNDRPSVCHYFLPASPACLQMRHNFWDGSPDDPRGEMEKAMAPKNTARKEVPELPIEEDSK
jgi:Fe-S-cluster containining protein